jgi:hypothetical protein
MGSLLFSTPNFMEGIRHVFLYGLIVAVIALFTALPIRLRAGGIVPSGDTAGK